MTSIVHFQKSDFCLFRTKLQKIRKMVIESGSAEARQTRTSSSYIITSYSSSSHMDYESRLASFCKTILHRSDADQNDIRRNDEFWEARNKAITDLTTLFSELEAGKSLFNAAVMKQLKEPVKSMISDQRSQQIRDTCILFLLPLPCFFSCWILVSLEDLLIIPEK